MNRLNNNDMKPTNLGLRCQYADTCKAFSGEETIGEIPLHIQRNVFCNRGIKGWKNCSKYIENKQLEESNKENS